VHGASYCDVAVHAFSGLTNTTEYNIVPDTYVLFTQCRNNSDSSGYASAVLIDGADGGYYYLSAGYAAAADCTDGKGFAASERKVSVSRQVPGGSPDIISDSALSIPASAHARARARMLSFFAADSDDQERETNDTPKITTNVRTKKASTIPLPRCRRLDT